MRTWRPSRTPGSLILGMVDQIALLDVFCFFFKQKTAYEIDCDRSSDVCSSDLTPSPAMTMRFRQNPCYIFGKFGSAFTSRICSVCRRVCPDRNNTHWYASMAPIAGTG